jgi:2Fe-2S iron-sulfur cluster binding domain
MARDGTLAEQILNRELLLPGDTDDPAPGGQTMRVSIRRTPPAPEVQVFEVPFTPGMSVFNVLENIRDTLDPSLAIPISCRIGKCDICFVRLNGRVRWSCTAAPIEDMMIEPAPHYVVMKDLVVDYGRRIKLGDGSGSDSGDVDARTGRDNEDAS